MNYIELVGTLNNDIFKFNNNLEIQQIINIYDLIIIDFREQYNEYDREIIDMIYNKLSNMATNYMVKTVPGLMYTYILVHEKILTNYHLFNVRFDNDDSLIYELTVWSDIKHSEYIYFSPFKDIYNFLANKLPCVVQFLFNHKYLKEYFVVSTIGKSKYCLYYIEPKGLKTKKAIKQ